MQLSNILKTLEAKRLIGRDRCPASARSKRLTLSDAAVDLLHIAIPRVRRLQDSFFGDDPVFGADLHARLRRVVTGWGDDD